MLRQRRVGRCRDDHAARGGRPNGPIDCAGSAVISCRSRCNDRSPRCRSARRSGRTGGRRQAGRSCGSPSAATACHRSTAPTTTSSPRRSTICADHLGMAFRRSTFASHVGRGRSRSTGRTITPGSTAVGGGTAERTVPGRIELSRHRHPRLCSRRAGHGAASGRRGRRSVGSSPWTQTWMHRRGPRRHDRLRRFGLIGAVVALVVGGIAVTHRPDGRRAPNDDGRLRRVRPSRSRDDRRPADDATTVEHHHVDDHHIDDHDTSTTTTSTTTTTLPIQLTQPIAPPQDPRAAENLGRARPHRDSEARDRRRRCTRESG